MSGKDPLYKPSCTAAKWEGGMREGVIAVPKFELEWYKEEVEYSHYDFFHFFYDDSETANGFTEHLSPLSKHRP